MCIEPYKINDKMTGINTKKIRNVNSSIVHNNQFFCENYKKLSLTCPLWCHPLRKKTIEVIIITIRI